MTDIIRRWNLDKHIEYRLVSTLFRLQLFTYYKISIWSSNYNHDDVFIVKRMMIVLSHFDIGIEDRVCFFE